MNWSINISSAPQCTSNTAVLLFCFLHFGDLQLHNKNLLHAVNSGVGPAQLELPSMGLTARVR